jgi:rhodanese-related sulfurtransferase
MNQSTISPVEAKRLLAQGAKLIDIRNRDEYLRERIPGAENYPLNELSEFSTDASLVIFHCKSGQRTAAHEPKLMSAASCDAVVLEGGIEAWKKADLPTDSDRSQPIEVQRQVQIAAGGLVLLGILLSQILLPAYIVLSTLVGAGLVFAGISGWCGMAKLFAAMPWNRRADQKPNLMASY